MWRSSKSVVFHFLGLSVWLLALACPVWATEMVYAPLNSTFGGNPNNAPGLMSIAQAQNRFTAPVLTPLEAFNLSIQKAILSRLASQTLTSIFGNYTSNPTSILQEHTYDTAAYTVDVSINNLDKTVTINTTDKTTGAVTSFTVDTSLPQ